jgi:hypothetical protein
MVGNDIYARSVFVSGSTRLMEALLADPGVECFQVGHGDPVSAEDR